MANATFGVNLIPKNNTITLGNSDNLWHAPQPKTNSNNGEIATTQFVNSITNPIGKTLNPIATKTYTNVIATANDANGGGFFYLKVRGTTYNDIWHVKVRVHATVPGTASNASSYDTESIFNIYGMRNTYAAYYCYNIIKDTSYRPYYYNSVFFASATGYNNNCGTWLGVGLQSSTERTNSNYKRTFVIDLLEYDNCTVEFQDSLITPNNIPNRSDHTDWYSSTNTSYTNFSALDQGLKISGDANTTSIVNLYYGDGKFTADSAIYRYQLLFKMDDDKVTPLNNVNNSTGTSKTMLTSVEFDPFDIILYYNSTTNISANGTLSTAAMYAYNGIDLRYSFNCGTTLTANKPLYLIVTPTSNGKVKIASSNPLTHTLPSTNDGKYYIFLGRTYSTYQMSLYPLHPVFAHDGTSVREITRSEVYSTSDAGKFLVVNSNGIVTPVTMSTWQGGNY